MEKDHGRYYEEWYGRDIPKIKTSNIPKEGSNVSFTGNLINSKPINSGVDELLNPDLKEY